MSGGARTDRGFHDRAATEPDRRDDDDASSDRVRGRGTHAAGCRTTRRGAATDRAVDVDGVADPTARQLTIVELVRPRAPRVVRRGREEYSKMESLLLCRRAEARIGNARHCVVAPGEEDMLATWVRRGDRAGTLARVLARVLAPGAGGGTGPPRASPRWAAPAARRFPTSPAVVVVVVRGFAAPSRSRDARRADARSDRLDTDINEAPDTRALMRVVLNEWDSLQPKHVADALRRLSRVAPWDRDAKSSRDFGDADFAPIVRRVEEIASARLDEPARPGRTTSRAGHREPPEIFAEEAFAVVAANALVNLGKRRAAFDPTRVGSPGWRAWRAVLALPAAPGKAPYTPRNVMRLWYAMATAHDAAGDDAGREAAVPDATWNALDAAARENARDGRHFNAQGVGIGVWSHAKTGKPIAPATLRAFEVAVARGAFDHVATVGQNVSNSLWGLAKLGHVISRVAVEQGFPSPWSKFEVAVRRLAPGMRPQEIANTMYAYALMGTPPSAPSCSAWPTSRSSAYPPI